MHLPFKHLFVGETKSIGIVAGGETVVFGTSCVLSLSLLLLMNNTTTFRTGQELWSTFGRSEVKTGPVMSAAVHGAGPEYLVTVTDDKTLRVWRVDGLTVVSERCGCCTSGVRKFYQSFLGPLLRSQRMSK